MRPKTLPVAARWGGGTAGASARGAAAVLALSNGLAIEQYADPEVVSDDLFGRVLAQLSREARPS